MLLYEITSALTDYERVAKDIKTHCKKYLNMTKHHDFMLYRGHKNQWPRYIHETTMYRKPKNLPWSLTQIIDDYFVSRFGHRYRTMNIITAVPSKKTAEKYGDVHVVFPMGAFTYLWSTEVYDFPRDILNNDELSDALREVTSGTENEDLLLTDFDDIEFTTKQHDMFVDKLTAIFDTFNFQHNRYLIDASGEVMVNCNRYIMIPYDIYNSNIKQLIYDEK